MKDNLTPGEMLDMTQPLVSKGWKFTYLREESKFKVQKRNYFLLMDIPLFQKIFIERADRPARSGWIREADGFYDRSSLYIGQLLQFEDEYYVVLTIGGILDMQGFEPWKRGAMVAHLSAHDLSLCNIELKKSEIDADLTLPPKVDVKQVTLN